MSTLDASNRQAPFYLLRAARMGLAVAFALGAALPGSARASHTGSNSLGGGQISGAIGTESAIGLGRGGWAFGLRTEYVNIQTLPADLALELHEADEDADLHRVRSLWSTSLGLAYGVSDDLTVGFRLPYNVRNSVSEPHDGEIESLGDATGFGDLSVFGQYRFFRDDQAGHHSAVLFGIKAPTGNTDEETVDGERFEAEHQPGSGSWDPFLGLAYTRVAGATTFNVSSVYTLASEGTQNTNLGDSFSYNAAVSHRLSGAGNNPIDLILELNGTWRERQSVDGERERNSGVNQLYLSPGIHVALSDDVGLGLSFGLPLVERFKGDQDKLDYRLQGALTFRF